MPTRNRWIVLSLVGLLVCGVAGLAFAAASEAEAAGFAADESGGGAAPVRHSKMKLVLNHDGAAEQLELEDLHELAIGESRSLTTESGTAVVVTRDDEGFEIDLDGDKIRLNESFGAEMPEGSWTSEDGTTHRFQKRVVVAGGGESGDGSANVMILRNKVTTDGNGAVVAGAAGEGAGHDVILMRRSPNGGGEGHAFAFTTGNGEMPAMVAPVEGTIRRLEASAKFQQLDAATRATVIEALRESAPAQAMFLAGEPGSKTIILDVEDEAEAGDTN